MSEDPYISKLRAMKPYFAEMNIARMRVFGSRVRGDAQEGSDMDILVDFEKPVGLIKRAGIQRRLEESLGITVDMVTPGGLHLALKDRILAEARDV